MGKGMDWLAMVSLTSRNVASVLEFRSMVVDGYVGGFLRCEYGLPMVGSGTTSLA